jgi:phosphoserine phosphatase RsbU/P
MDVLETLVGNDAIQVHELQCMEIWNGNQNVEQEVSSQGLQAWVYSQPYQGAKQGGDIHYLSLCVGGDVTRIILADVAGHGDCVGETSRILRTLLRRFMNAKKQDQLVVSLNRHFSEIESRDGFATAIVATFLSRKSTLLLTNAGHPRPLLFRVTQGTWSFLTEPTTVARQGDNLPFGLDPTGGYQHFVIGIQPGDWLLLYTDSYTESSDSKGALLGEEGLMRLVNQIPTSLSVRQFGIELNRRIAERANQWLNEDDTTIIVLQFHGKKRIPGLIEKLRAYANLVRSWLLKPSR